jgi:hypothetical protein
VVAVLRNLLPFGIALISSAVLYANPAEAAVFVVDSAANSSSGGTGLSTFAVAAGQKIRVSSSTDDLWSLGALPRFSDGDGLVGNRFATALDDSGQTVGTLIGQSFGLHSQNGLNAAYGALVGEIGGVYRVLGANGVTAAWGTGTLSLYNWDSNSGDNEGSISFDISIVPEPATWALLVLGFGLVGAGLRSRRPRIASTSN